MLKNTFSADAFLHSRMHVSPLKSCHTPNIACTEKNRCFAWSKEHKCCKTDSSSNGESMYKYTELYFSQSCQGENFAVRAVNLTGFFSVFLLFGLPPSLFFLDFFFLIYVNLFQMLDFHVLVQEAFMN